MIVELGPSNGIRLRFETGFLIAILLDLHRKPTLAVREHLLGIGVRANPLPAPEVGATHVKQELGVGVRELNLVEARGGQVTATLRQRFALRAPMEWRLQLDENAKLSQQDANFEWPNKVTIAVEATAPCVLEPGAVRVALPEGNSEVTLSVTSKPVFDVSDTIVACRPDQMREAAIVVSCLSADRFTPIIAIDPPPMHEADYISQYDEFYRSQEGAMGQLGGAMGRAEIVPADIAFQQQLLKKLLELHSRRSSLTSYRSWVKRNQMISSLISQLGIERVVFLHNFTSEELAAGDPGPAGKHPARMFENLPVKLDLSEVNLLELSSAAWQLLRGPDSAPPDTIEVPVHDTKCYVAALFTALTVGAVLCAAVNPMTSIDSLFADANYDAEDAVLVEDSGDTVALLGALYAHYRSARLVITPQPDLESVQSAVAEHQRRVTAAARAIDGDLKSIGFVGVLRRYLSDGGRSPYAAVEAAVTAQVPPAAIAEVGERRLTAFTSGLPYSFVCTREVSWSSKPIGHVTADADLIILNELYSVGVERSGGAFSLVFDPGFFRISETKDVMRSVGTHFTHPILLSDADANMFTAIIFPRELPVELIFFNTHGSDDGILLADVPLANSLIVQWMELIHRPIVFNNSCQSWTGVGREFIRVGARGYIGTLWSIPSNLAADFARIVVDRLTAGEELACKAIINTGLSEEIERSYLYVGTANGRLDQWRDRAATIGEIALMECSMLADAVPASYNTAQVMLPLRREVNNLRHFVEGTPYEWTLRYADVLLSELSLTIRQEPANKDDIEAAFRLVERIDQVLKRLDALPEDVNQRWADRFGLTGELYERFGHWAEVLKSYKRSISYGDACKNRVNILVRMASASMYQGEQDDALRLAHSAYDESKVKQDRAGLMAAVGILGQLSKRLNRFGEAMDYVKEGYALALELSDRNEQGIFKLDESFLHQQDGDFDSAIAAATMALELFRASYNDRAELSAIGRLGVLYREKGDLEPAERYAKSGLVQALKLAIPNEIAGFHHDIASVLTLKGHHAQAISHYHEAVTLLSRMGSWELAVGVIADLAERGNRLDDADSLWLAAIWGSQMCIVIEDSQWSRLLSIIVPTLKKAIEIGTVAMSRSGIAKLAEITMSEKPNEQPLPIRLLGAIGFLLWNWIEGSDRVEPKEFARSLDRQTGKAFRLEEFVGVPYSGPDRQ